jgi:hypothetical protein
MAADTYSVLILNINIGKKGPSVMDLNEVKYFIL